MAYYPNPSNILIATLGAKPQIITLALDCLRVQHRLPHEVVVVHTYRQRPETAQALSQLEADFALTNDVVLRLLELGTPTAPLHDVIAPEEVDVAFRALYAEVQAAKLVDKQVHLLIAGGRRTLTVFGMAVAQLLFDAQDCLWHLTSHPDLEASGRLHAAANEWARLIPIPLVTWGQLSPVFDTLRHVDNPFVATERLQALRLREQWEQARNFVLTKLSESERRVVQLLVHDGLENRAIAERLSLSERTVEQHLRAVYAAAKMHWDVAEVSRVQLVALLNLFYITRGPLIS